MKPTSPWFVLLATLFAGDLAARAQSYAISSFTIGRAGGTSSGGSFTLSGSIGQPAAGALAGGSYQLLGGFWNDIITVPIAGGPTLTILRSGSDVILAWPLSATGFLLEATDNLSTSVITWTAVSQTPVPAGENQSVTVGAAAQARFFRLRRP